MKPEPQRWPKHCDKDKGVHVYRDSFECECKDERMDRRREMMR